MVEYTTKTDGAGNFTFDPKDLEVGEYHLEIYFAGGDGYDSATCTVPTMKVTGKSYEHAIKGDTAVTNMNKNCNYTVSIQKEVAGPGLPVTLHIEKDGKGVYARTVTLNSDGVAGFGGVQYINLGGVGDYTVYGVINDPDKSEYDKHYLNYTTDKLQVKVSSAAVTIALEAGSPLESVEWGSEYDVKGNIYYQIDGEASGVGNVELILRDAK